jgi:preprotein translocase subunit SecA
MLAEMKTGEGKTLVATLPVYLNALHGKGVHVVTVNDYLAKRDADWMGQVYGFLGLKTGCILHAMSDYERKDAYDADITYGTNHEFGFDYLRDNMKFSRSQRVMRPFNYAIVDEVDSILIDEARTPLIISGPAEDSSELYIKVNSVIPKLQPEDFEKDEKHKTVVLTESGVEKVEHELQVIGLLDGTKLYDSPNVNIVHHVNASLRAHKLFTRDVDYIVRKGEVIIVDEFTGRMMEGRRFSEGLHQALEAKEHVDIQRENQTLASITYQNFFRLYPKLSGMGGTIVTEEAEFEEIYKLKAVEIPTNRPIARKDWDDEVYLKAEDKYAALVGLVRECMKRKQPVLIGTTSVEKSELLSSIMKKEGIKHEVLNARNHDKEALIVANAGKSGAITISTNMAGRGTDIKLGGNWEARVQIELGNIPDSPAKSEKIDAIKREIELDQAKVLAAGGLFVIGTERHESRRIDNQLRGRSGRQGDPGASKFFISLEDDLMRIFGSNRMDAMLRRAGMKDGEAISHKWISKAIERAQKKVEAHNFEIRKHLLKYDDVMNDQRKVVYSQRLDIMEKSDVSDLVDEMRTDSISDLAVACIPEDSLPDHWEMEELKQAFASIFDVEVPIEEWKKNEGMTASQAHVELEALVDAKVKELREKNPEATMKSTERSILLRVLDQHWKDHLLHMDYLRQGINLRAYAQSNPLNEYKRESFSMFSEMMRSIRFETIKEISHFKPRTSQAGMDFWRQFGGGRAPFALDDIDDNTVGQFDFQDDDEFNGLTDGGYPGGGGEDGDDDDWARMLDRGGGAGGGDEEDFLKATEFLKKAMEELAQLQKTGAGAGGGGLGGAGAGNGGVGAGIGAGASKNGGGGAGAGAIAGASKNGGGGLGGTGTGRAGAGGAGSGAGRGGLGGAGAGAGIGAGARKNGGSGTMGSGESQGSQGLGRGYGDAPVQRNAMCPCGSQKRYKHCCGLAGAVGAAWSGGAGANEGALRTRNDAQWSDDEPDFGLSHESDKAEGTMFSDIMFPERDSGIIPPERGPDALHTERILDAMPWQDSDALSPERTSGAMPWEQVNIIPSERDPGIIPPERGSDAAPLEQVDIIPPERDPGIIPPERGPDAAPLERGPDAMPWEPVDIMPPERDSGVILHERGPGASSPERTSDAMPWEQVDIMPPERDSGVILPERGQGASSQERTSDAMPWEQVDIMPPERDSGVIPPERGSGALSPERTSDAMPWEQVDIMPPERDSGVIPPERGPDAASWERGPDASSSERTSGAMPWEQVDIIPSERDHGIIPPERAPDAPPPPERDSETASRSWPHSDEPQDDNPAG